MFSRHRHHALDQRLVLLHGLIYGHRRRDVAHNSPDVNGQSGRGRNLSSRNGCNQLLLAALRIAYLQWLDTYAVTLLRNQTAQMIYGIGLVVLDADDGLIDTDGAFQDLDTYQQLLSALQHRAVVRRKVRLALHAVYDEVLGLAARGHRQLHVRGEGSAAHTDNARILYLGDDGRTVQRTLAHQLRRAVYCGHPLVTLAFDRYHHLAQTLTVDLHIDCRNGTRYGRVDIGRHETRSLGYELSRQYLVALCHLGHIIKSVRF